MAGDSLQLSTVAPIDDLLSVDVDSECFGRGLVGNGFAGRGAVRAVTRDEPQHGLPCARRHCAFTGDSNALRGCFVAREQCGLLGGCPVGC